MTERDIVGRLRKMQITAESDKEHEFYKEAADEIERLRAENAELRAALQIWMQGPRRELEGK